MVGLTMDYLYPEPPILERARVNTAEHNLIEMQASSDRPAAIQINKLINLWREEKEISKTRAQ